MLVVVLFIVDFVLCVVDVSFAFKVVCIPLVEVLFDVDLNSPVVVPFSEVSISVVSLCWICLFVIFSRENGDDFIFFCGKVVE